MRLPRPATLWRAISIDLWKLLLLTAAVVVAVGAFALALRPVAEGRIGPEDAARFMLFGLLPMLQYALPFAAGFAATLVYHRLAGDNEILAAHAGGISHRALLMPAGAAGLVLSVVLFALSDTAIPRLLRSMEELLTQDAVRLIITPIRRGESIQFGPRVQVHADDVASPPRDPSSGDTASERYVLTGALAVELDDQGRVVREAAARTAYIWIHRTDPASPQAGDGLGTQRGGGTTVVLRLQDATSRDKEPGVRAVDDSTIVYRVPNFFSDDPKFLSWRELNQTEQRPETMNWIDRPRRTLAALLDERAVVAAISEMLASRGRAEFTDPSGRAVTLRAARVGDLDPAKGWALQPTNLRADAGGQLAIEVLTDLGGGRVRTQRARRAFLAAPADDASPPGTVALRLEEVATVGAGPAPSPAPAETPAAAVPPPASPAGQLREWSMTGLSPALHVRHTSDDWSVPALLARAEREADPADARISRAAAELRRQTDSLHREILSKKHERLAASAACFVMVLCGAVMAMRLRDSLPLAVYLWSFLPALGTLLSISGGQRLTHQYGSPGLALLWGGVAALALYTLAEFRRLARH